MIDKLKGLTTDFTNAIPEGGGVERIDFDWSQTEEKYKRDEVKFEVIEVQDLGTSLISRSVDDITAQTFENEDENKEMTCGPFKREDEVTTKVSNTVSSHFGMSMEVKVAVNFPLDLGSSETKFGWDVALDKEHSDEVVKRKKEEYSLGEFKLCPRKKVKVQTQKIVSLVKAPWKVRLHVTGSIPIYFNKWFETTEVFPGDGDGKDHHLWFIPVNMIAKWCQENNHPDFKIEDGKAVLEVDGSSEIEMSEHKITKGNEEDL